MARYVATIIDTNALANSGTVRLQRLRKLGESDDDLPLTIQLTGSARFASHHYLNQGQRTVYEITIRRTEEVL